MLLKGACALACLAPLAWPSTAQANEPLVPFILMFSGATPLGAVLMISIHALAAVVLVKFLVFAAKSGIGLLYSLRDVFVANAASTAIGVLGAAMFSNSFTALPGLVAALFVFRWPAKRATARRHIFGLSSWAITALLFGAFLVSGFLLTGVSNMEAAPARWWVKMASCSLGLPAGMLVSVLYEEAVISKLHQSGNDEPKDFFVPVLWANIVSVTLMLGTAAYITVSEGRLDPAAPFFRGAVS